MTTPLRVFLADDHTLVRAGIRSLLNELADVEVVGEAGEGREALRRIGELRPDVVLLDIGMPGLNGLELAARVTKLHAPIRVVMLSMHTSEEYVLQALRAGAVGYLVKGSDAAELPLAVRAVARGECYLSPAVSRRVVEEYAGRTHAPLSVLATLTSRQREILQLIAEGSTSKEIAQKLNVSYRTIESHRTRIMERLGVQDLTGLVRFAVRVGLVAP